MKMLSNLIILLVLSFSGQHNTAKIDYSQSSVKFSIGHAGMTAYGEFEQFILDQLVFDPNKLSESIIEARIKAESINTGIGMRDNELRAKTYLHVAEYPFIYFKAKEIRKVGEGRYLAIAILTIRDVSKEISLPFSVKHEKNKVYYEAEIVLNRRDFNVGGKSWILADELTAKIVIQTI
jgi:polyisoprenoid-binding protein YceI